MRNLILGLLLFVVPSLGRATPCENAYQKVNRTLLAAIPLNGAEATRTFTLTEQETQGFGVIAVYINYTWSAATAITMTCYASDNAGTTYFQYQSCSTIAGVCTSSNASWTKAVGASANWVWRIDNLGSPRTRCVIAGTGAAVGDVVTVRAYVNAQ